MEINQIEAPDYITNEKYKNRKHNKFNEDIMILDNSLYNNETLKNKEIKKNPIFVLTIELERGKNEKLEIFSDSNPDNLAKAFCNDNNLDFTTFQYLKEKVEYLLKEFNNNKEINIQKCINEMNNELNKENNVLDVEEDKENQNDYFNYILNEKNNQKENNKQNVPKGFDVNNITIKKNNISKHKNFIRNSTDKLYYKNIRKSNTSSYKSKKSNSNLSNENNIQSKMNNYFLRKNISYNDKSNSKINTYYNYYTSKCLNNVKITNDFSISFKNAIKANTTNREKTKKENDDSFIDEIFKKEEKERESRGKSPYFRSFISKNDSYFKNMSNYDTHSSSKLNSDISLSNRKNSLLLLDGIKYNIDNPIIINNKKMNNYGQYLFERNKISKREKQNEIYEIQRKRNMNIHKLCSFMPKTNIKRNSKIQSKYKETKSQKIIVDESKTQYKPKINNNYNTDLTFEQRQEIFNNLYKKKNEELKKYFKNSKYDEKGNELFKPKLISKQLNKNENNENIFDKNYSYYKKYDLNKKQLFKKFYKTEINNNNFCSKEETDKIISETYSKIFTKLFKDLDSDQDDLITSLSINISDIPENILKILKPILKEMKDDNQTLNCEEFILVMIRLFKDISLVERQNLINYYRNKIKYANQNMKRPKTPIYFMNDQYTINDIFINNSNFPKSNSTKYFNSNNRNEKLAYKYEKKVINDIQNVNKLNNEYNGLEKNKYYDRNFKENANF